MNSLSTQNVQFQPIDSHNFKNNNSICDGDSNNNAFNSLDFQTADDRYPAIKREATSSGTDINLPAPTAISLKDRDAAELTIIVFGGFCLAFNAGFINGVTYSAIQGLPVSHVSGTSTQL